MLKSQIGRLMMRLTRPRYSIPPLAEWDRPRRWALLLVAFLTLLAGVFLTSPGALAGSQNATPDYGYSLEPADEGDSQQIPILIYRHRHTVIPQNDRSSSISWARNVAEFEWVDQRGPTPMHWVIVTPNVSGYPQNSKIAPIDLFLRDANGELHLVDTAGNPLMEADGKTPVNWQTSTTPSYRWDLTTEPDLGGQISNGSMHSERLAYWFLKKHMSGANSEVLAGLSEKIPCDVGPSRCQQNLRQQWFNQLSVMKFLTDRESQAKLKKDGTPEAKEKLRLGEDSDSYLANEYGKWNAAGRPTGSDSRALMGGTLFSGTGGSTSKGIAAGALSEGADPGGIDFSTLELRYISEDKDGQLHYAFDGAPATGNDHKVTQGRIAAAQMSDAFYVWLSLPPSTFWVNLNPTEPDRIIDAKLGTTDVGRILLQADFQMKKLVGQLVYPDTDTGRQFWAASGQPAQSCISMRQWIVPKPATVYEEDGGLYIVDAPLEVKMETDYLSQHGAANVGSCANPDQGLEAAFRTLILPKVEDAVNHGPDFADLRRVYLSRVAAEWYRQHHASVSTSDPMIDSGDVSRWPALQQWSSRQVFDQYVESYTKKEFNVQRTKTINGQLYDVTYTYGGVDFSQVTFNELDQATFHQDHSDMQQAVQSSFQEASPDQQGRIWLGSANQPQVIDYSGGNELEDDVASTGTDYKAWWIGGGLLIAAVVIRQTYLRRRRAG